MKEKAVYHVLDYFNYVKKIANHIYKSTDTL